MLKRCDTRLPTFNASFVVVFVLIFVGVDTIVAVAILRMIFFVDTIAAIE